MTSTLDDLAPFSRSIPYADLIAQGLLVDHFEIDKFGGVAVPTKDIRNDVWGLAGTWLAPTVPRIHDLSSSDPNDTLLGTGARTVRLSYLPDWSTPEVEVDLDMAGTDDVETPVAAIINRMEVVDWGGAGTPNIGQIEAVAQTDLTTTAVILVGQGQTEQAIIGIPAGSSAYLHHVYSSILAAAASAKSSTVELLAATRPDVDPATFIFKWGMGLASTGTSAHPHEFTPPRKYRGPVILKLAIIVDVNSVDVEGGFDGYERVDPS